MLLCRLAIRTLHHRHNTSASPAICAPRSTWLPAHRSYSSPSGADRQDEELDLSKLSADSAYLDLLLGPAETPSAFDVEQEVKDTAGTARTNVQSRQAGHNSSASLSPRQPRRKQFKLAASPARPRRAPSRVHKSDKPQRTEGIPYTAKTLGRVQQLSEWHMSEGGQNGPTISVRRLVPAIAPTRTAHASGVEHRKLKIRHHRRLRGAAAAKAERPFRFRNVLLLTQSEDWKEKLAMLRSNFDKRSPRYGQDASLPPLHPNAGAWATFVLKTGKGGQQRPAGSTRKSVLVNLKRRFYWEQAALWILSHQPERAVEFLVITHRWCNGRSVSDVLQHVADKFTHSSCTAAATNMAALVDAFPRIADRGIRQPLLFTSSFLRLLMTHCNQYQVDDLYRAIKAYHVRTGWLTWLHFATHLARTGQFEQGLAAIIESSRGGAKHDSFAFRSTCATLLRAAIREPSGLRVCLRVIDNFVKLGVTLNIQLCNIVMLNAVEAGDQRTAFAVYSSLVEHGLQADAYTYAILLKGCKAAIDDADGLNTTIRQAIEHIGVTHQPIVATEIIHCLALHHSKHNPDKAFDAVADAYAQLFDLEPLRKLGIVLPHLSARLYPDAQRMPPSKHVVQIMIAAHLDHTFKQTQSTANAYELYRRFLELADEGVQPFRGLLETDHTANVFMMTFGKTKKGLVHSAQVIKDMQRGKRDCCEPTVQTWTIFMESFIRHGQMNLAEQLLLYMRRKGMSPNQVTWNVLTAGYATAQDVEGTLDALRRMEEDGKLWDRWTEGGLRNLRDKQSLSQLTQLTQSQYTRRLQRDVDADLKEVLQERISSIAEDKVEERPVYDSHGAADSPADLAEAGNSVDRVYKPF